MEKFFKKIDKKVLCLIAALIAVLIFVVAILDICENNSNGVGNFINSLISVAAFSLLILFILKGKKDKSIAIVLILIGSAVLVSFGNSISSFITAGEYNKDTHYFSGEALSRWRTLIACTVFIGLTYLTLFIGVLSHVSLKFTDKLPADKVKLVGTLSYLATMVFALVAFILMLAISGDSQGNQLAISIISMIGTMAKAFLLACLLNQDM